MKPVDGRLLSNFDQLKHVYIFTDCCGLVTLTLTLIIDY